MWEGPVILIAGNIPAKLSTKTYVTAVKPRKETIVTGCAALFLLTPPSRRRLGVPRERSQFLSLRLIHHPRMVDPPGLAIDKQNVQACHVVTHGIWEDTEKCWVVLLNPRLVLRYWQPGLRL